MTFNKKNLEIKLSKLEPFNFPKNYLEQYPTESSVAAGLVWQAYLEGNIFKKTILDAGAGTGILSYGALSLGCEFLTAVEIDNDQKQVIEKNLSSFQNKEIIIDNISSIRRRFDTVLCNPPFGAVRRDADIPFLERIFTLGNSVYIIHNLVNDEFMTKLVSEHGEIISKNTVKMGIPMMYSHHTMERKNIDLIVYSVRSFY
ncbi:MAG: METTL5 family protein [Candidatus Thermoplasmatota archaeon]|nr:METTL5 family protein [Candidatus Thermoplasmatota archaeon]